MFMTIFWVQIHNIFNRCHLLTVSLLIALEIALQNNSNQIKIIKKKVVVQWIETFHKVL